MRLFTVLHTLLYSIKRVQAKLIYCLTFYYAYVLFVYSFTHVPKTSFFLLRGFAAPLHTCMLSYCDLCSFADWPPPAAGALRLASSKRTARTAKRAVSATPLMRSAVMMPDAAAMTCPHMR